MSASNDFETNILKLTFSNADYANVGDAGGMRGSVTAGSLYISLHTGDPGEAGTQQTNEATYTSYARVAVARTAGAWTVSGNSVTNAATVSFPACTGGSNTITYFGIGTASSGAGILLFSGTINSGGSLVVSTGITPSFAVPALSVTCD